MRKKSAPRIGVFTCAMVYNHEKNRRNPKSNVNGISPKFQSLIRLLPVTYMKIYYWSYWISVEWHWFVTLCLLKINIRYCCPGCKIDDFFCLFQQQRLSLLASGILVSWILCWGIRRLRLKIARLGTHPCLMSEFVMVSASVVYTLFSVQSWICFCSCVKNINFCCVRCVNAEIVVYYWSKFSTAWWDLLDFPLSVLIHRSYPLIRP